MLRANLLGATIVVCLCGSRAARADGDAQRIALADLIDAAVRKSPGLVIARADREEARDRSTAAGAADEWHLIGRLSAQDTAVDRALAGPGVALDTRSLTGEVGVRRGLSTGGAVEAAVSLGTVSYLYQGLVAAQGTTQGGDVPINGTLATARIVASQPLLRGRGSDVARADQALARLDARTQEARGDDEAAAGIRELAIAYWELAYANEALAVDRDGEALATRQIPITQEVVRLGLQPPSAMKIAELQVALRHEAVLRDRAALAEQSLAVRRLAGLELDATPMVPSDAPPAQRDWDEPEAVAAALAHGPGVAQQAFARRGADVAVDVADNAMWPKLDATLTAQVSGVGPATGDAFDRVTSAQMYTVVAGLAFQYELGGAAAAAKAGARVHRARLEAEHEDLDGQVAAATISAVRRLRIARERIDVSQIAVDVAGEALRAELVAFSAGRSTNVLVFQRQDDLAQAKLRLARARIDAVEARIALDYLTGGLLDSFAIKLARHG